MNLRLSVSDVKALEMRMRGSSGRRVAQVIASDSKAIKGQGKKTPKKRLELDYDLGKFIVDGLELAIRSGISCAVSPQITTLNLGLKALSDTKVKSKPYERIEQALTLLWLHCTDLQSYSMTTANPMGGYRPDGAGGQMKGEGAKSGYPDLLMDRARNGYHGLRIEMKKYNRNTKPSEDQETWLTNLSREGFKVVCCRGHQAAIWVIAEYLGLLPVGEVPKFPDWCITEY